MLAENKWKRLFGLITVGQVFSLVGSSAASFAIIWWMTIETNSAIMLTLASIINYLPQALLSPIAGVWVDRINRKTVMMVSDGVVALSSAIIAVAFIAGTPSVTFILSMILLRSIGNAFHGPAFMSVIPSIVPPESLLKAGGWGKIANSGATLLGPAIGALLLGIGSIPAVMMVDIVGAAFAIGSLLFVKLPKMVAPKEKLTFFADMKDGFSTVIGNKALLSIFFPSMIAVMFGNPMATLFPLFVRTHFNGGVWHTSAVEMCFTVGVLLGAVAMGMWGSAKRKFTLVTLSIFGVAITSMVMGMLTPSMFAVFIGLIVLMGISCSVLDIPLVAYIQESTDPAKMGKVMSLVISSIGIAGPIGMAIAGPAAEYLGITTWFVISGTAMLAAAVWAYLASHKYEVQYIAHGIQAFAKGGCGEG